MFNDAIYRINLTKQNELEKAQQWSNTPNRFVPSNNSYLIDYDPVEKMIYYVECSMRIRPVIMSCAKTRGVFRVSIDGNNNNPEVNSFVLLFKEETLKFSSRFLDDY